MCSPASWPSVAVQVERRITIHHFAVEQRQHHARRVDLVRWSLEKVAIEHGQIGRLYRSGSVIADSKRFFTLIDAVGNDLRLIAIPNCGKGQPMQIKRMSNGGPTLRSRARLGGG